MGYNKIYLKELKQLDKTIADLEDRKVKLPLMSTIIDASLNTLKSNRDKVNKKMLLESNTDDRYIQNILKKHNSIILNKW